MSNLRIQELNEQKKIIQLEIANIKNSSKPDIVKKDEIDTLVNMVHDINEEIEALSKKSITEKNNMIPIGIIGVLIFLLFLKRNKK
jgi:hypothetical protein